MKKMKEPVVYVWKKDIKPGRVRTQTVNKTYNSYIASSAWQAKRVKLLKERGAACEACRKTTGLHVHHVDYSRLYYEEMSDLLVLCERCHDSLHAQYDKHKEDRRFKNMRWKSLYEFSMTFLRKALNKK